MNVLKKQKMALLLQGDVSKLVEYFEQFEKSGIKTSSVKAKLERWKRMESNPAVHHGFFELSDVKDYLDDKVAIREQIIDLALCVLNDTLKIKTAKKSLEHHYDAIFESACSDYGYLAKYKNSEQPYYKDRFEPGFLDFFLNLHPRNIRDVLHQKILRADVDGEEYLFPAINLLPDGVIPSLNNNLLDRDLISVPEAFTEKVTHAKSENRPTFALNSFDVSTGEITCYISSYYRALYSCDIHFFNIISLFPGLNSKNIADYKNHKSIYDWSCALERMLLDHDFSDELSLGVSCLLVYNTPYGFETLLAKKHPDANGASDAHVVPAGMMQPQLANPDRYGMELDLEKQVLRELAEEVFNYPEDEDVDIHPNLYYASLYRKPQISHIKQLMAQGKAKLHVTGLYMDLFRMRPEVLTMLVIEDESWYETQFTTDQKIGNWEYLKGSLMPVDMTDDGFKGVIERNIAGYLCAPGAACFIKGYEKFSTLGLAIKQSTTM